MDGYALLDAGDGARLERFGPVVTDRPHAGALAPRRDPDAWRDADLRFDREDGWSRRDGGPIEPWSVRIDDLEMGLRATDAGQVGLFPEHASTLDWLTDQVRTRAGGRSRRTCSTCSPTRASRPWPWRVPVRRSLTSMRRVRR